MSVITIVLDKVETIVISFKEQELKCQFSYKIFKELKSLFS